MTKEQMEKYFKESEKWKDYKVSVKKTKEYFFIFADSFYAAGWETIDQVFKMFPIEQEPEDYMCHTWSENVYGQLFYCDPHFDYEHWEKEEK